ncbi:unnamed protein product [Spirodela intermedia]|uniref:Uncharacterized protein n=1 Tax=Spirodela intermedia TaxID=51605 RepID=A0A7I8K9T0_SPIIN|nr:unnamed protein product [Spirodela intermedia]
MFYESTKYTEINCHFFQVGSLTLSIVQSLQRYILFCFLLLLKSSRIGTYHLSSNLFGLQVMEELPELMKICYLALYKPTNEIGYKLLMNHMNYLKNINIFCLLLIMCLSGWKRSPQWGTYVVSLQSFLLLGCPVSEESLRLVCNHDRLFSHSVPHARKRPHGRRGCPQAHQRADKHAWKDLNGDALAASPLPFTVINGCFNLARLS